MLFIINSQALYVISLLVLLFLLDKPRWDLIKFVVEADLRNNCLSLCTLVIIVASHQAKYFTMAFQGKEILKESLHFSLLGG